ncbi:MAG: iron-containing alcohol dehydrogenase, partial [Chloroflexota bacterium]|nr:iron-containing alcohol dehydrogenase [Chloroflexota bacterium]
MATETIFTMDSSSIKYGAGATAEIGFEMARLGATRVMVVTDANLSDSDPVGVTLASLKAEGIDAVLYDRTRVEPTDASFREAIAFATEG